MSILTDEKAFADLIEAVVEPNRANLRKQARGAKFYQIFVISVFVFIALSLGYAFYSIFTVKGSVSLHNAVNNFGILVGTIMVSILVVGISSIFYRPGESFKNIIVPSLISYYGDLTFRSTQGGIEDGLFGGTGQTGSKGLIKTALLPSYTSLQKSDQIQGRYRGRPIYMLDVEAVKRERSRGAKGKSSSSEHIVFRGVMGCVTVPKNVSGRYALTSAPARHSLERIKLESPDFEKRFDFFGEDQIEGRKLMTPAQMEKWMEFARRIGKARVNLWFEGDRVWFAIQGIGDFLDRGILKGKAADLESTVWDMAVDIEKVLAVVNFVQSDEMPEECARG